MDTLKAITSRRSIRKYTAEPISEADQKTLLNAAMTAPSAFDERPWHFVVMREKTLLCNLADKIDHCEMLREANMAILICGDQRLEKIPGFWSQDCSACTQNVLLAAHALGLGAVWLAVYPLQDRIETLRAELGIPQEVIPFALVSVGYPAEKLEGEERFDAARVHCNRWLPEPR